MTCDTTLEPSMCRSNSVLVFYFTHTLTEHRSHVHIHPPRCRRKLDVWYDSIVWNVFICLVADVRSHRRRSIWRSDECLGRGDDGSCIGTTTTTEVKGFGIGVALKGRFVLARWIEVFMFRASISIHGLGPIEAPPY